MKRNLLVIAGEVSGDMHAAQVVRAIRKREPETVVWGIGGDKLRAEGVELLQDVHDMAVIGFSAVLKKLFFFVRVYFQVLREVKVRKPDAVMLVDYPGFNLRLARYLHKRGIKVYYYISPQVWAWHRERIPLMAKIIDRLMVIFPFEVDVFKETTLQVEYVGHPLVGEIDRFLQTEPSTLPWQGKTKIALLPGSRKQEVARILPVMLQTARRLEEQHSDISFIVPVPNERIETVVRHYLGHARGKPEKLEVVKNKTRETLRQADAAIVASGTATLETALIGCPMVVIYIARPITVFLARRLVDIKYICIVNIIADHTIVTELIQQDARPDTLCSEINRLLNDSPERAAVLEGYQQVRKILGDADAGERVAEIILGSE